MRYSLGLIGGANSENIREWSQIQAANDTCLLLLQHLCYMYNTLSVTILSLASCYISFFIIPFLTPTHYFFSSQLKHYFFSISFLTPLFTVTEWSHCNYSLSINFKYQMILYLNWNILWIWLIWEKFKKFAIQGNLTYHFFIYAVEITKYQKSF